MLRSIAAASLVFAVAIAGVSSSHADGSVAPTDSSLIAMQRNWKAGTSFRYKTTWQREGRADPATGGTPVALAASEGLSSMNHSLRGDVVVSVLRKSADGYALRWEPAIPELAPLPEPADMAMIGLRLKDFSLTLAMTIALSQADDGFGIAYPDAVIVRLKLLEELRRLTAATPAPVDCVADTRIQDTIICRMLGSNEAVQTFFHPTVSALLACSGIRVDPYRARDWSSAHPSPQIGDAVMVHYHEEVVDYRAKAPTLHVRRTTAPDADQLHAWMRQRMAGSPGSLIRETVDKFSYTNTLDCTMETATGWPLRIEDRTTSGAGAISGAESVRFERIEPASKARRSK